MHMVQYKTFDLGPFALQKGTVLPDAKIVYATVGRLNDAKDNAVLVPTWGSGSPEDVVGLLIGTARTLNPEKYFIVIPNHFGGGFSSSPSNYAPPFEKGRFPRVTTYDNVNAQRRLLVEAFGITSLRLVAGWSMGAMAAYHWAAFFRIRYARSYRSEDRREPVRSTRYFWRVFAAPSYPIPTGTMASMATRRRYAA
jgi:homoserine O-acetyltransferase